jgi:TonB family protein
MIGHLFESTLFLAATILVTRMPRLAARTRYTVVFAGLMKFAIPSAIVAPVLARLGIELARVPRGTIVIEVLGPLSAADGAGLPVSRWPSILISLWLLVAIGLLARALFRGRPALRRALANAIEATPSELAALGRALERTRLESAVRLLRSQSVSAPATAGMLRPVILIPAATQLSSDELETILTHECAHVARRDNVLAFIETVACCALWFHPLVWIARRILDAAREEACDAAVIASGDPDVYITALGKVCGASIGPRFAAVSCIVSNTIRERMEAIMTFGTRRPLSHRAVVAVVIALLTATTFAIGVARALPPASAESDSPRVDIRMSRDAGGNYLFEIAVRDRATGGVITSAMLKAHAEEPATMDASNPELHVRAVAHQDGTADVETRFKDGSPIVTRIIMKSAATSVSQSDSSLGDSPLRVGGSVKAPVVINRVEPIFPDLAKKSRISGIVIVEVIVDHTGVVKDARILKPLPFGLDQAALDAVRQWTFHPATLNGNAVDVIFNLTINFRSSEQAAGMAIAIPKHSDSSAQCPAPANCAEGISIDLKDGDIRDVMKTFSQLTNTEIAVDDDVSGRVTLQMTDAPWMDVFEAIMHQDNLRFEREGNTIRVHRQ